MTIVADPQATLIPAGTWTIDPPHTTIEFHVTYAGVVTVKGRAPFVSGTIRGGDEPAIEGTVSVADLTTFDETRDTHLRSPDFFDVERYPELRFVSTSVESRDGEVVVHGDLTIRGMTKPVELRGTFTGPVTDPWGRDRIGLDLAVTVDRTEFGVSWNAPLPSGENLLPDEIPLYASLSAIRSA
jgi:polyisoprenoid-binding protein YceI